MLCRGAGQPVAGEMNADLSLLDRFTISIMCALCGQIPHTVAALFFLRTEILIQSQNTRTIRLRRNFVFYFSISWRCIFIVALACFVRLTFQVQVYYHRWCNGSAHSVGSTNTRTNRPVSFVFG